MEGPDRCGKTTIAKYLAKVYNLEYWRYSNVDETLRRNPDHWKYILRYYYSEIPEFAKMLENQGSGLILDRNYITEWVYSKLFKRDTYPIILADLESQYAELGAVTIYCTKKKYDDFEDEFVTKNQIDEIKELYENYFLIFSKMPVLWLDTTNEDLEKQLEIIDEFLKENVNVDEN